MSVEDFSAAKESENNLIILNIDDIWSPPPAKDQAETQNASKGDNAATPGPEALSGERLQSLARNLNSPDATAKESASQALSKLNPNELVNFLGSESFRNREAATSLLSRMGVRAINALEQGRQSDDLETARRSEMVLDRLDNHQFGSLVGALRSPDQSIRQTAELRLSRMSTDDLLSRASYNNLEGQELQDLGRMIRNRLSDDQIRQLYGENFRKFGKIGLEPEAPDENSLRRSIVALGILGENTSHLQSELGQHLSTQPGREQEAERFLQRSLQGQNPDAQTQTRSNGALAELYSRMPGRIDDARRHFNAFLRTAADQSSFNIHNSRDLINRVLGEGHPLRLSADERRQAEEVRTALQNQITEQENWKNQFGGGKIKN